MVGPFEIAVDVPFNPSLGAPNALHHERVRLLGMGLIVVALLAFQESLYVEAFAAGAKRKIKHATNSTKKTEKVDRSWPRFPIAFTPLGIVDSTT